MTCFLFIPFFFLWSILLNQSAHYLINSKNKFFLFPYFEIAMSLCFSFLWHNPYFYSYFLFFSALGITIQTDLCCMLISRFASLYLLPIPITLSFFNLLPIHVIESSIATLCGYGLFYSINKIFYIFKKENGLGQGDFDLMALIGAYTGMVGIWFTVLCGSILGAITACMYMIYTKKRIFHIPFGPFLSLGAIIFVLLQRHILYMFL